MCMVEVVDGRLPWTGVATGAEVPHRVTTSARPVRQLKKCDAQLADLIRDCWEQRPEQRPDFSTVVERVEAMLGIRSAPRAGGSGRLARGGESRPLLPPRGVASDTIAEADEEEDDVERAGGAGLSRPASPSRGPRE